MRIEEIRIFLSKKLRCIIFLTDNGINSTLMKSLVHWSFPNLRSLKSVNQCNTRLKTQTGLATVTNHAPPTNQSSFPVIHKVGNVDIFVFAKI